MKITIELELDNEKVLQSIGRQLGKVRAELSEEDVQGYLIDKLSGHLRDVATRAVAHRMSTQEVRRRVYHTCCKTRFAGTTPIVGATDKELMVILAEIGATRIRWARYWLEKNGYLEHVFERSSGKVWEPTTKKIPDWLQETPQELLALEDGPGEEDGEWAEGWEKRSGMAPRGDIRSGGDAES